MYYYIGCSGFNYKDWKGKFYPEDLRQKDWFNYYAQHFNSVELNSTFYRLPKKETFLNWYHQTPDGFRITVKGSRYITHLKKLNDVGESVQNFYEFSQLLGDKLGCVLWQLPRNVKIDYDKLQNFCHTLNTSEFKNVMEFRHPDWYNEEVYDILKENNVGLVIVSAPGNIPSVVKATTPFAYVRFHGKEEWFKSKYSEAEMEEWGGAIKDLQAEEVYIYFNNDYQAYGVENARYLQGLLGERVG